MLLDVLFCLSSLCLFLYVYYIAGAVLISMLLFFQQCFMYDMTAMLTCVCASLRDRPGCRSAVLQHVRQRYHVLYLSWRAVVANAADVGASSHHLQRDYRLDVIFM